MRLSSKYDTQCATCGGAIKRGDLIEWSPDYRGARHPHCLPNSPKIRPPGQVVAAQPIVQAASFTQLPPLAKTLTRQEEISKVKAEVFGLYDRLDTLLDRLAELEIGSR